METLMASGGLLDFVEGKTRLSVPHRRLAISTSLNRCRPEAAER
jgi:hypothetical protein